MPELTKSGPMPADQRLRLEDCCGTKERWEQSVEPDENQSVGLPQNYSLRRRASEDQKLLAEKEDLSVTRCHRFAPQPHKRADELQNIQHDHEPNRLSG